MGANFTGKHISIAYLCISVILLLFLLVNPAAAQETTSTSAQTCSNQNAGVFLELDESVLVVAPEGQQWGITQRGPYAVTIPSGVYTVQYVSFDSHAAHGDLGQTEEKWYVEGYYQGVLMYTSETTLDVPADTDYISGTIGTNVSIPEIDSILIKHALPFDPDGRYPQSVHPVCVEFVPVEESPVCEEPSQAENTEECPIQTCVNSPQSETTQPCNPRCDTDNPSAVDTEICFHECDKELGRDDAKPEICMNNEPENENNSTGVLGATTSSNQSQQNPHVLAASDTNGVLADTGVSPLMNVVGGLSILGGLFAAQKRLQTK